MKNLIAVLIAISAVALPCGAQEKSANRAPAGLPAGAREIAPWTYRLTDSHGTNWIYRQTPFGFSKYEEKQDKPNETESSANIRAHEEGDSVRFETVTPFGPSRWVRKKSELSDLERRVVERERRNDTLSKPTSQE